MGHLKRAVAVVNDACLDGIARLIVRNPVAQARLVGELLAQRVSVGAGLGVFHGAHGHLAVGIVGASSNDLVTLDKLELELAGLEVPASQNLGRGNLAGDAGVLGRQAIGILELGSLDIL